LVPAGALKVNEVEAPDVRLLKKALAERARSGLGQDGMRRGAGDDGRFLFHQPALPQRVVKVGLVDVAKFGLGQILHGKPRNGGGVDVFHQPLDHAGYDLVE
jgi:hypothetical protein